MELTAELARQFADLALGHVRQEFPHKLDHVLTGPDDLKRPSELHPIFHGSFDWHSCVHAHWLLARVHRRFPDPRIPALFHDQFTPAKVAGELAYLERPASRGFERPYGWAWLLKLQAELLQHPEPWADKLHPLAEAFASRLDSYLRMADYPVRSGVHSSTWFALLLALDYARAQGLSQLEALIRSKARLWRGHQEPSQTDFLSPTLLEAALLRELGEAHSFQPPPELLTPATVADRSDGQIAHLDGLNLSRAWCWRLLRGDPAVIQTHLDSALPHLADDYAGEHWLATFALLALDP